ncbi:helix-turn-helix transcriptional regulator [Streptacidiphilus jiangxiensis]|uniref:Regulatory protein, luxR family n=1 Tax=Streptacidiphilus jiangxiensis TaxID=235985 RepID=A0A1H7JZG3_STRJI|nr:LuxR C-terminal-related transcriptional regulator [Streptacidiphilus jiangxiensis]SEK79015.1 regulatory protein, luxR family [Streptacidiphilus jiangxiensis]
MLEALGLSAQGAMVYRALLDEPGSGIEQLAARCGLTPQQVSAGFDELADLMLLRASGDHPGQMRAVSPELGLADMLARQEAELAARHAQLAASRAAVARMVAERAESRSDGGERLLGIDAVRTRLEQLCTGARTEITGAHPGVARQEDLDAAQNFQALNRGVAMRTLYQDIVRNHAHFFTYAHRLLSHGGEVRTAPVIPQRVVIVDRAQALVPLDPADTRKGALHVAEPGIVAALLDCFEQAWNTAVPLGAISPEDPATGLTGTERELLRLLGAGLTDEAAGQRLGLSVRTVRRHMASIMERLGATSRFEAGLKAAQRGWL